MVQARGADVNTAELERYMAGLDFPANKVNIVAHAEREGAPPEVIDFVRNAPNRTYENLVDLTAGGTRG